MHTHTCLLSHNLSNKLFIPVKELLPVLYMQASLVSINVCTCMHVACVFMCAFCMRYVPSVRIFLLLAMEFLELLQFMSVFMCSVCTVYGKEWI